MDEAVAAPDWVAKDVLPSVQGPIHNVQMLSAKSVIVFAHDHALVAEKGAMSGLRMYRADYPPGLLVNGSHCPHCGEPIREPIAKIAKLASPPKSRGKAPKKKGKR